jgi:HTH-type transcriptional regulator, sugar sensing transcriptional regulator
MSDITKQLIDTVGLSEKEVQIYLALLALGEATVIEISNKTKIKRTTVYNLIPGMIQSGFIKTAINKKRRIFFVEDVRTLKLRLEEKKRKIDVLLPELQAMHNIIPIKPKIIYYEGEEGMKDLYMDTLNCSKAGDVIYAYTGMSKFYDVFPKDFADYYIAERVKRKIRVQVIAPKTPAAVDWLKTAPQTLREIKLIDDPRFTFKADTEIYGNKVALISYKENFMGVIIESKEICDMQKSAFELMWGGL